MRKTHQFLLKSFVFILALSFTVLTFIGCKNNDNNSADNTSNVSTIQPIFGDDNKNNNADYVTDENQNKPLFEIKSIYDYANNPTFNNVTYDNLESILSFFNTRDLNGVHKAAKKLGFDTFIKEQFILDSELIEYFISFDNTDSPAYTTFVQDEFGNFMMLDENKFNYELIKNIFINDAGNYVLQIQFTYTIELGEVVETPLMINLELIKVATYIVK